MPQSPSTSFSQFSFASPSRRLTQNSDTSSRSHVSNSPGSLWLAPNDRTLPPSLHVDTSAPPVPVRTESPDEILAAQRFHRSPPPSTPVIIHDNLIDRVPRRRITPPNAPNSPPNEYSRVSSVASSANVSPTMSRKSSIQKLGNVFGNAINRLVRRKTGSGAEDAWPESGSSPERPSQSISIHDEVPTDSGHGRTYRLDPPPSPLTPRQRQSVIPLSPSLGGKHRHHWPAPDSIPTRSFAPQRRECDDPVYNTRPDSAESKVLGAYWTNGGWVGDGSGSESEEDKADSVDGDSAAHLSPSSVRPVRPMSGSSAETAIYRGESQKSRSKDGHSTEDKDGRVVVPELESYSDLVERLRPLFPSPPVHTPQMGSTRKRTREPKKDASLQGGNPADPRS
jgi:hypothetical protein